MEGYSRLVTSCDEEGSGGAGAGLGVLSDCLHPQAYNPLWLDFLGQRAPAERFRASQQLVSVQRLCSLTAFSFILVGFCCWFLCFCYFNHGPRTLAFHDPGYLQLLRWSFSGSVGREEAFQLQAVTDPFSPSQVCLLSS